MRRMMLPVAAAVTFGAAPYLSKLGVVSGSAALVALGALRDAAELRRQVHAVPLDDATASTVAGTWRALRKLAESRLRIEKSKTRIDSPTSPAAAVVTMLDQRIRDHVSALARAYTAVDTAHAAAASIDDAALKNVENASEHVE